MHSFITHTLIYSHIKKRILSERTDLRDEKNSSIKKYRIILHHRFVYFEPLATCKKNYIHVFYFLTAVALSPDFHTYTDRSTLLTELNCLFYVWSWFPTSQVHLIFTADEYFFGSKLFTLIDRINKHGRTWKCSSCGMLQVSINWSFFFYSSPKMVKLTSLIKRSNATLNRFLSSFYC